MKTDRNVFYATIRHHSIARARIIKIHGTLTQAKRAATREFRDEQRDYQIVIIDLMMQDIVARKNVGGRRWLPG